MFICQMAPRALARAISLAMGMAALPASALDYTWVGGYGDWETATNWDPVGLPQDGDNVAIYSGSLVTYNTAYPLYLTSVTVDGPAELHLLGSSLHAETLVAGATAPWIESEIHLSGGYLSGANLLIGRDAGSDGRFLWDGGDLDVGRISVGTGGSGTFVQDIGWGNHWTLAPHQSLVIGEQAGSHGVFEQLSGSVDAYAAQIIVGEAGQGQYRQLADHHIANETVIGHLAGSEGTYEMGALAVSHSSERTTVGDAGTGHFIHNAGQHYTNELIVGRGAGATGDYLLNAYGGVSAATIVLGQEAGSQGTFTWVYGNLDIGRTVVGQAGTGRFVLEGWNNLVLDDYRELIIGELAGSDGVFEQQGGHVTNTRTLFVGDAGRGAYRQTAGQHNAQSVVLGRQAGSEGVYELSGESASLSTQHTVIAQQGMGEFLHTAGLHYSDRIDVGGAEGVGRYRFSGGHLDTASLDVNNGEFHWTGGGLDADEMHVGRTGGYGTTGVFVQDIGPGNTLFLGWGRSVVVGSDSGEGVYEQRSGDVDAREGQIVVGGNGRGFYYHLDGLHLAAETVIGRHQEGSIWNPSQGTYGLFGETAIHSAERTLVGDTGRGRFLQSAGLNDTAELIVGRTGAGEYLLDGGVLNAQQIVLGDAVTQTGPIALRSDGRFFWTGGGLDFTSLVIGRRGTAEFDQDIGPGNTLRLGAHQSIVIAEQVNSQGAFVQRSGDVDSRDSRIVVGQGGSGVYDQTGGLHLATETVIGALAGSQGNYYLSGTARHVTQHTVVGAGGYGAYYQSAGFHDTQELVLAQSSGAYGYYDLYAGDLTTDSTRIATTAGATGGITVHGPDAYWHNSGTIDIGAAPAGHVPSGAAWVELRDGSRISATAVIVAETGALKGRGSVAADVVNAGALDPGVSGAGRLEIIGDYTQLTEGALFIQIGGHAQGFNADIVNIFGAASLAGALNVSLLGGYQLSLGDSFDILYANLVYGSFEELLFPVFDGLTFAIFYDMNTVRLAVVSAVPVPAAMWLFGSGVVALMGMARRRKAA